MADYPVFDIGPQQKVEVLGYVVTISDTALFVRDIERNCTVFSQSLPTGEEVYSISALEEHSVLCISANRDMKEYAVYTLCLSNYLFKSICRFDGAFDLEYEVSSNCAGFLYRNINDQYIYCKVDFSKDKVDSRILTFVDRELIWLSVQFSDDLDGFLCFSFSPRAFHRDLIYVSCACNRLFVLKSYWQHKINMLTYFGFEWKEDNTIIVPLRKKTQYYRLSLLSGQPVLTFIREEKADRAVL